MSTNVQLNFNFNYKFEKSLHHKRNVITNAENKQSNWIKVNRSNFTFYFFG